MRILIGPLAVALLAGCSTSPISAENAKPVPRDRAFSFQSVSTGNSTLIVTRDSGFTGGGCNTKIMLNGKLAAEVGAGESVTFHLPPGDVIIGADGKGICSGGLKERELTLQAGSVKRYRISIDSSMSMDISPTAM